MKLKRLLLIPVLAGLGAALLWLLGIRDLGVLWRNAAYYLGDPTETEVMVMDYAREHGITLGDYPPSLIDLLERNPETAEFVLGYPFPREENFDLSEYENSETVPLFLQWDRRWGYEIYGSDVIGITGCGPTCLAMVGYYLTGNDFFRPDTVAEFAWDEGYYSPGSGSSWTLISEGGVELGLDVTEIPLVKKRIVDNLEVGNPIICAMGAGDFTTSGHYIVLPGLEAGKFRVNDPNSVANSERLWAYEEIEDQIRNIWVIRYFG